MLTKRYAEGLAKAVAKEKVKIAAARDRLRELLEDAEAVASSSDDAIDDLDSAVEKLSQYV